MDTQALSIACKNMEEHGDKVVADLKRQLANERRQNTTLRKQVQDLEDKLRDAGHSTLAACRECDRLRTHITTMSSFLSGLGRQCEEHRRRMDALKWFE